MTTASAGDSAASFTNKTAFGVNEKFDNVSDNIEIPTQQFLKASSDAASIMDRLGSGFSVPKKDMMGNIKTIEDKWRCEPDKFSTLKSIVEDMAGQEKPVKSLADAILWLKRGLEFIAAFVSNLSKDYHGSITDQALRPIVISAYEITLKPFHGRMTQFLFSNVSRLVPNRDDFIKALMTSEEATFDMVISDIDLFLVNFMETNKRVDSLLTEFGFNSDEKCS